MRHILKFLIEAGRLKDIERKGVAFYGVCPDSAADHTFRMAIMVWLFGAGRKKLNTEKTLKIALMHDLCKVFTGDITPYDGLLPEDKKERDEFVGRWRRLPLKEKTKRHNEKLKKEYKGFNKLVLKLPGELKKEMLELWVDYHEQKSPEARFVFQIDMAENLVEAFEGRQKHKGFPTRPWWEHADEVIDDPALLEFLEEISRQELKNKKASG